MCILLDCHASLISSDFLISGCDLKAVVSSYSSPIPTCNDGTGRGPLHPKRPRISRCGNGQLPLQISRSFPCFCSLDVFLLLSRGPYRRGHCRKPRRESVPPSWAEVPTWTGLSSRAARDRCLREVRYRGFPSQMRPGRRPGREEVPPSLPQ